MKKLNALRPKYFVILVTFIIYEMTLVATAQTSSDRIMFSEYYPKPTLKLELLDNCTFTHSKNHPFWYLRKTRVEQLPDINEMYADWSMKPSSNYQSYLEVFIDCPELQFSFDRVTSYFGPWVPAKAFQGYSFIDVEDWLEFLTPNILEKIQEAPLGRSHSRISRWGWEQPSWVFQVGSDFVFRNTKSPKERLSSEDYNYEFLLCSPDSYLALLNGSELQSVCAVDKSDIWLKVEPDPVEKSNCIIKARVFGHKNLGKLDIVPYYVQFTKNVPVEKGGTSCRKAYLDERVKGEFGVILTLFYTTLEHLDLYVGKN